MHYNEPQWLGNAPESRKAFGSIGSDEPEKAVAGTGVRTQGHPLLPHHTAKARAHSLDF